jgi:hypothetical protein
LSNNTPSSSAFSGIFSKLDLWRQNCWSAPLRSRSRALNVYLSLCTAPASLHVYIVMRPCLRSLSPPFVFLLLSSRGLLIGWKWCIQCSMFSASQVATDVESCWHRGPGVVHLIIWVPPHHYWG